MDAIIFNFDKLKQEYLKRQTAQKEELLFEYRREIIQTEEQIRRLVIQINELQSNIDFNYKLISRIKETSSPETDA